MIGLPKNTDSKKAMLPINSASSIFFS